MKTIKLQEYTVYSDSLNAITINSKKKIINTINAHSYIVATKDKEFKEALMKSDILLPDGEGIILMAKKIYSQKIKKIAGADIHEKLLKIADQNKLKCFYLGASNETLKRINDKISQKYKNVTFGFFSPPFKAVFSKSDDILMLDKINSFDPDILFVGMTAPKQEKWVYKNQNNLNAKVICSIGAVFDFIAETKKRAPQWLITLKMEWLYRSFTSWRLTKRYMYSTPLFVWEMYKIKYFK